MEKKKWLRIRQVMEIVPVSKSTIGLWVSLGKFPKPHRLGDRVAVWDESEVNAFVEKAV